MKKEVFKPFMQELQSAASQRVPYKFRSLWEFHLQLFPYEMFEV
jgi:hypothetical protein